MPKRRELRRGFVSTRTGRGNALTFPLDILRNLFFICSVLISRDHKTLIWTQRSKVIGPDHRVANGHSGFKGGPHHTRGAEIENGAFERQRVVSLHLKGPKLHVPRRVAHVPLRDERHPVETGKSRAFHPRLLERQNLSNCLRMRPA